MTHKCNFNDLLLSRLQGDFASSLTLHFLERLIKFSDRENVCDLRFIQRKGYFNVTEGEDDESAGKPD